MKKSIFLILVLCILLSNCNKAQDPFEISKQHIGLLTDSTQVKDIESIFASDSISKFISGDEFAGSINNIEIFKKGGEKMLVLTPENVLDSTSVIESIQVLDPQYKTAKGISTLSTFKDISAAYKISKINNQINSVAISVKEINASFVIDKKELPPNLQFDLNLEFQEAHIPDDAKIKYFFLLWNN
ncbi:hypothetical protein [Seonamhaeicola marinus]|uniref:Lipid/polyisoprenoid-binding YceI-like domain-containing protein n=1 Tax=Seonamhaeicola marinus TaxID=1912246 RepID=A0A5D0IMJ5_9FLAO|nr:hypothetical protein [Seonamhaeicola marinus]TYA84408.1 hypothetical protein FUA24_07120 [Seonamhaeicola marinus]